MLISFIISQNRNIPAIQNSIERLSELAGQRFEDAKGEVYFSFPTAEAIAEMSEEALGLCKLGYRTRYVRAAAEAVIHGELDLAALRRMKDEESLQELTKLFGVGVKVANCVQLYGLHRVNAFPIDVWVKRILEEKYPKGYPYESYAPYNGIYQQYMFAHYRNKVRKQQ